MVRPHVAPTEAVDGKAEVGQREKSKARRRAAILDSTLLLLRDKSLEEISIEAIAAQADVAPATVYNLLDSRDVLLLACVNRLMNALVDDLLTLDMNAHPIESAVAVVEKSCEAFIADSKAFRQIVSAVNRISQSGASIEFDPAQLQVTAIRSAQQLGLIRSDVDAVAVGRQIYLSYNGAMFAWAAGQLTDAGFRATALHGLWTALTAFAADKHRNEFLNQAIETAVLVVGAGYGRTGS